MTTPAASQSGSTRCNRASIVPARGRLRSGSLVGGIAERIRGPRGVWAREGGLRGAQPGRTPRVQPREDGAELQLDGNAWGFMGRSGST